jgi:hypothetical protein
MAVKKKVSRPAHTPPKRAKEQDKGGRSSGGGKKGFDNKNRGALFLNDKDGNDARPDYTGIADIEITKDMKPGSVVKFRLAGWSKTPNSGGADYLSLSIQKADKQGSNRKGGGDEEEESGDEE